MFLTHYDDGNRDLRFAQNGDYSFKNLLQETKTKNHSLQISKNFQCQSF